MLDSISRPANVSEEEADRRIRKIVRSANASSKIGKIELRETRMFKKLKDRVETYKAEQSQKAETKKQTSFALRKHEG